MKCHFVVQGYLKLKRIMFKVRAVFCCIPCPPLLQLDTTAPLSSSVTAGHHCTPCLPLFAGGHVHTQKSIFKFLFCNLLFINHFISLITFVRKLIIFFTICMQSSNHFIFYLCLFHTKCLLYTDHLKSEF